MAKLSKLMAALGAVFALGSAQAITVAGVTWNPNSIFDFSATDSMIETRLGTPPALGDTIRGFALINTVNGTGPAVFCGGTCEVTYQFSGFTVTNVTATGITFSGGLINLYVDSTPDYNSELASTAGPDAGTTLFLQLAGHLHVDAATGLTGTLHSDPTPASTGVAGDGRAFLDVTGGVAAAYFDTNTKPVCDAGLVPGLPPTCTTPGLADLQFTSSFQLLPNPLNLPGGVTFVSDDGVTYGLFGSNDIQGDTKVPEPATLLLAGLGLLGAAASRRRKA